MMRKRIFPGIIADTTSAIWTTLQPMFVPPPNESKWKSIADRYFDLWNLPNSMSSIDGKHFRIKYFPKTGSMYCNYKVTFSIILLACADLCNTVHIEDFGKNSDCSL
jgi:hypothetical protein